VWVLGLIVKEKGGGGGGDVIVNRGIVAHGDDVTVASVEGVAIVDEH